jgi:hypothetical protein
MQKVGQTFASTTEFLDGNEYVDCTFNDCQIVFGGGDLPGIVNCQFNNCRWQFANAAERTLKFMRQVYHGMGAGGAEIVEATLNAIRQPLIRQPLN